MHAFFGGCARAARWIAFGQAVMFIFKTMGLKCVPFLPQIMRTYLHMMRTSVPSLIDYHFNKLAVLVSIVRQHVRNYLDEIFALCKDYWPLGPHVQITIISLVKSICTAPRRCGELASRHGPR